MSRFLSKYWPVIGIAVLVIVIGFYLFEAWYGFIEKSGLFDPGEMEGFKLKNIHYIQSQADEKVKWTLDATEVKFSRDKKQIFFKNFRLKLEPENRPSLELKGRAGDYDTVSSEINLRGGLHGSTNNGYSIITEHLLFRQKQSLIKSDEKVRIIGPFFSVTGQGLFFDLEKESFKILSDVTTAIERESLNL